MRKIYSDVMKNKISKGDVAWFFKKAAQYTLIHLSFWLKRPLCGPILGTFLTNYTCNYRCKMCDLYSRDELIRKEDHRELSTEQLKKLLEDFAAIGTSGIGFTGGEPLLRKDIFELLKHAKDLGMVTHLNTNGFLLNEERVNKLFDIGVDSINISLDGATPKTHNNIRGHESAYEKATSAVLLVDKVRKRRKLPIRVKVVCVINQDNIDEIEDLVGLAMRLGADCAEFIPEQNFKTLSFSKDIYPRNETGYSEEFYKKLDKVVDFLLKTKQIKIENSPTHLKLFKKSFKDESSPLICYAGYNSFGVDCYGFIYPCMPFFNWGQSVGNVREMGLKEFWYSKRYDEMRKVISKCRNCYINCQAELNILFNPFLRIKNSNDAKK